MGKIISSISIQLDKLTVSSFIIISFLLLIFFIVIPFELVKCFFNINLGGAELKDFGIIEKFIFTVLFAPLLETLIFQIGVINLIQYLLPKPVIISITISALLFGLSHFYNSHYIIYTFLIGLFFGQLYFISLKKQFNPFLIIFSVHALYNLTVFVIKEFV